MSEYTTKTYGTALVSYEGKYVAGDFTKQEADDMMYDAMKLAECFRNMDRALAASMKETGK
jgi:hypothetical protein